MSCGSSAPDSRTGTSMPMRYPGDPMAFSNQARTSFGSINPSAILVKVSDARCVRKDLFMVLSCDDKTQFDLATSLLR